ncbi:protein-disulfide reductase DsbD family protein [Silvanigrella aquatica]|uniref:Thioredoxin domain-containing protein n=1 Tax=Silvanigrella aquatica TaxID=1915309 RepID=A0A1L4CZ34_9BACT|nr:cytochrome c biogenesis protein CcdA [Silvanigrella aquatica]APJ03212.1 hypothetical protein AXG55_04555 [Silvanigrella aquatica]
MRQKKTRLLKIYLLSFLTLFINLLVQNSTGAEELFSPTQSENHELNNNIKIQDVIEFKVLKIELLSKSKIYIQLNTKNNFKIYEDKLKFSFLPENSLPFVIKYQAEKPSQKYLDPFYKTQKNIFKNGSVFIVEINHSPNQNDILEIKVQACSQSVCLVPSSLFLNIIEGKTSQADKNKSAFNTNLENHGSFFQNKAQNIQNEIKLIENMESNSSEKITLLNDNIALKIQNAIKQGSWILFPALFLAGLLMNLTPCVYPMIPITLNVMAQFGDKGKTKKKLKSLPFIYVGGMILTYSLLGVFAGMTGSIFGSHLANPIVNWFVAILMFVLGLSMLGLFQFTAIQSLAHKIPLAQNYPRAAVATMGAVSGFISAPCTGPVLSTILLLIAQNKNPLTGFTYMFFFSLGFGIPYIALGYFSQRISKLPKFPRAVHFVKIFFAALMFALALYYVRTPFQKIPIIQEIYSKPHYFTLSIVFMLSITFIILTPKKDLIGKLSRIGLTLSCTFLALWLTLASTNSFYNLSNKSIIEENISDKNSIHWTYNFDDAVKKAKKTGKPILFDIWAEWCTACMEMKETTWKDPQLIQYINDHFIAVELNFTDTSDEIQKLIARWEINGLPAVGILNSQSQFDQKPDILFQGFVPASKILNTPFNIYSKN